MTVRAVVLSLLVVGLVATPVAAEKDGDESLNCLNNKTQKSGSGENFFETCVSDTGSVPIFRTRQGSGDNIASDGYMICDSATGGPETGRAWSRGGSEANFSFPTTRTSTSNVRTTADGRYRLSQTFTRDAVDKQMVITMTLKNQGPGGMSNVWLQRYTDADAHGSTSNIYLKGQDSIVATDGDDGRGLVMGVLSAEVPHETAVSSYARFNTGDPLPGAVEHDDCFADFVEACPACPPPSTPTSPGDYVGYIRFNLGSLAAGASKTVKIYYRKW
jgi:hypothetical protein